MAEPHTQTPGPSYSATRIANPHLEDWSAPGRVGKTTSSHIFTDKRSNQKLKRGSDLPEVTWLEIWQDQLSTYVS